MFSARITGERFKVLGDVILGEGEDVAFRPIYKLGKIASVELASMGT